jgi:hypothetical protein
VSANLLQDLEKRKTPTFSFSEMELNMEISTPSADEKANTSLAYTNERINRLSKRLKKTIEKNFEQSPEEEIKGPGSLYMTDASTKPPISGSVTAVTSPKVARQNINTTLKAINTSTRKALVSTPKSKGFGLSQYQSTSPGVRDVTLSSKFEQWGSVKDFFSKENI